MMNIIIILVVAFVAAAAFVVVAVVAATVVVAAAFVAVVAALYVQYVPKPELDIRFIIAFIIASIVLVQYIKTSHILSYLLIIFYRYSIIKIINNFHFL